MKNARDWLLSQSKWSMEEIQLDAFKAGMEYAAEICGKDAILLKRPEEWGFLMNKKKEIVAVSQALTEIPK